MPVENGLIQQPRRGRAITVRTPGRHSFVEPGANPLLDDPNSEPADDDLLELDAEDDNDEEGVVVHDDSEELEMWMR